MTTPDKVDKHPNPTKRQHVVSQVVLRRFTLHSVSSPQPGDLVFFGTSAGANHVAIYAGNGYTYEDSGHANDIIYRLVAGSGHSPLLGYRSLI